jgi:hypothetical protein
MVSLCRALLIQFIFNYFNDMSFITINTMISMPVPGVAQILLQVLLNLVYLDLLMTDLWLPSLFQSSGDSVIDSADDEPLN